VAQTHGRAGSDAVTSPEVEAHTAVPRDRLPRELREGTSQAHPGKRGERAKAAGGGSKLGLPALLERGGQPALVQRREPLCEPRLQDGSCG